MRTDFDQLNDSFVSFDSGTKRRLQPKERVACFTPESRILTTIGELKCKQLRVGDKVITRDNGEKEILWIGSKQISLCAGDLRSDLQPILIRRGAIDEGFPDRDLLLSPNHRLLLTSKTAENMFCEDEVLVAASHLAGLPGIEHWVTSKIEYMHFLCDGHEIVQSNGIWTETFHPNVTSLETLGESQKKEIVGLFPDLNNPGNVEIIKTARPIMNRFEAQLLAG